MRPYKASTRETKKDRLRRIVGEVGLPLLHLKREVVSLSESQRRTLLQNVYDSWSTVYGFIWNDIDKHYIAGGNTQNTVANYVDMLFVITVKLQILSVYFKSNPYFETELAITKSIKVFNDKRLQEYTEGVLLGIEHLIERVKTNSYKI